MSAESPVQALHALRRSFGPRAAQRKLRLLEAIHASPRLSARELVLLQSTLDFMRAYPDDARVLARCRELIHGLRPRVQGSRALARSVTLENSGVPGSLNVYGYSYVTLAYLMRRFPGGVDIDWDDLDDETRLTATLEMLLTGVENEAMEDVALEWPEWMAHARQQAFESDAAFFVSLFERSHFTAAEQAILYDGLNLQVRYRLTQEGSGRCEVERRVSRPAYQKRDIGREKIDLRREIQRPMQRPHVLGARAGAEVVDLALRALASRNLEIHPLFYANPRDVTWHEAARAVHVALIGVVPEHRSPWASSYFFMVLKNGVPIAYGPASVFLGSCEMGINLFPEFRGGEIRMVYAQVMRLLHRALDVEYFYLTSYGMGVGNEEAIRSGAFWFYRSLGFSASNPAVEKLARSEEERMRAQPGYRSDRRMLRRLSDTEAYLDLSGGRCRRFPFGKLGLAVSRFIAERFDGDRPRALASCARKVASTLGVRARAARVRAALGEIAPVLTMIPDLEAWSARDKAALVRALRAKTQSPSEAGACVGLKKHRRLATALFAIVDGERPE